MKDSNLRPERTGNSLANCRSTAMLNTALEQNTGFEPALSAWEADVLTADTNSA